MLELISQMLICLIAAAILGGFIGYLIGRIKKCNDNNIHKDLDLKPTASVAENRLYAVTGKNKNKIQVGIKPPTLEKPEGSKKDDLKEISGIGIKIEDALNSIGIFHFHQIAKWTQDNIDWIDNYLSFKGRVNREEWVEQAKRLAVGGGMRFNKKNKENKD